MYIHALLKRPPVSIYKMCQLKAEWLKHPWISAKPLLTAWLFSCQLAKRMESSLTWERYPSQSEPTPS